MIIIHDNRIITYFYSEGHERLNRIYHTSFEVAPIENERCKIERGSNEALQEKREPKETR